MDGKVHFPDYDYKGEFEASSFFISFPPADGFLHSSNLHRGLFGRSIKKSGDYFRGEMLLLVVEKTSVDPF